MRKWLLTFVLFAGGVQLAQAQWMAGLALVNVAIWPQPDLRIPVPATTTAQSRPGRQDRHDKDIRPAPLLAPAGSAVQANARALADRFPAGERARIEQAFVQSMDVYGQLTRKLDIPQGDMAASLAAFIVGNYMAMNEADVPDDVFRAVARQLREQDGLRAMGRRAGSDQLRTLYEQSAMIGTFMALTWKSQQGAPQPPGVWANVRDAARANLQTVLRTDPSRLRLDGTGMHLER